jgi:hypothetical protein
MATHFADRGQNSCQSSRTAFDPNELATFFNIVLAGEEWGLSTSGEAEVGLADELSALKRDTSSRTFLASFASVALAAFASSTIAAFCCVT